MTDPAPIELPIRLTALPRLAMGGRWRTEAMRSYRVPVLYWITRGQGRVTVAGVTRGYGAHNAIFVPAGVMHGLEMTGQVFGTVIYFDGLDQGSGRIDMPDHALHLRVREAAGQNEMTGLLEAMQRELDSARFGRARALFHLMGLLSVWIERQVSLTDPNDQQTAALRLAGAFTDMIEAQLYTGQALKDYAEALGVTPTHLSRVCRETCQRSASDLLNDRVMYEARRLLADTPMTVRRVAEVLGFRSPAYFTRAFQKRTGHSPTEFRARRIN